MFISDDFYKKIKNAVKVLSQCVDPENGIDCDLCEYVYQCRKNNSFNCVIQEMVDFVENN